MDHVESIIILLCRFPLKKEEELKKWIHAVKRKGFIPKSGDRLCSLHFKNEDFILSPSGERKVLKPGAVPSIFPAFPAHLQPKKKCVRKPRNIVREVGKFMNCNSLSSSHCVQCFLCPRSTYSLCLNPVSFSPDRHRELTMFS